MGVQTPRVVPFGAQVLRAVGLLNICVLALSICMPPRPLFTFEFIQVCIAVCCKIPRYHFFHTCYAKFTLQTQCGLPGHSWPGGVFEFLSLTLSFHPFNPLGGCLLSFLGLGIWFQLPSPSPLPRAILPPLSAFFHGSFHNVKFLDTRCCWIFICLLLSLFPIDCKLQQRKSDVLCLSRSIHLPGTWMSGTWKVRQLLTGLVNVRIRE